MRIWECLKRNPNSDDEIVDEAMISYFNSFCEFILDRCETYLVATENYIPNKSGVDIIELSSNFGFISSEDAKKLQGIVRLRNRHTHDFYQRKLVMKKVITYGTFDLLHYGHINILKRAKEQGDYLIVALSTNEFNEVKGKKCYFSYEERKNY